MKKLANNQSGIVGLILLGLAVLVFIGFVGKRIWDARRDAGVDKDITVLREKTNT